MADTADMAPSRAPSSRARSNGTPARRSRARKRDDDLEAQIDQLQSDLKKIAGTITRMAEQGVGEAQGRAESEVRNLVKGGQQAVESVQDEFGDMERQLKETIRRKPLTAVAGAIAIGFCLALISR